MKKILVALLVCLLSVGCSSDSSALITDEKYMSKISKEENVVDFVLDGKYYTLPCSIKEFTDSGWKLTPDATEDENINDIVLRTNEYAELSYTKGENTIKLRFVHDQENTPEITLNDESLVQGVYLYGEDYPDDLIIAKEGIHMNADHEEAVKAIQKRYKEQTLDDGIREKMGEEISFHLYIGHKDGVINEIRLEALAFGVLQEYTPLISRQSTYESNEGTYTQNASYNFPTNYEAGLTTLTKNETLKSRIECTIEGPVDYTTQYTYEGLGTSSGIDKVGYLAKDTNGRIYVFSTTENAPALETGATYVICATASSVIYDGETPYPFFNIDMIKKGEEAIYVK